MRCTTYSKKTRVHYNGIQTPCRFVFGVTLEILGHNFVFIFPYKLTSHKKFHLIMRMNLCLGEMALVVSFESPLVINTVVDLLTIKSTTAKLNHQLNQ